MDPLVKIEGLDAALQILSAKDGDIIIMSGPGADAAVADPKIMEGFVEHLKEKGLENVMIFLLPMGSSLKSLSEKEMNESGWYRKTLGEVRGDAIRTTLDKVKEDNNENSKSVRD